MRIEKFYIMKHILLLFATLLFSITTIEAQPNANYYKPAEGKTSAELKTALFNIIKEGHRDNGYNGLWEAYKTTDKRTDGKVWDMYSNCNYTFVTDQDKGSLGTSECQVYNREHTIPQSWFGEKSPMKSDIFHVYPADKWVNAKRSNYPYGEVNNATWTSQNGSKLGSAISTFGYSGTVFEPIDEYKGDLARTYLYMATRYLTENFTSGEGKNVFTYSSSKCDLTTYAVNLFLKWHRQDQVSEKETNRNNAVEKIQKNRNPFIDHPNLAEYIWGENIGQSWYINNSSGVEESLVAFNIRFVSSQNVIYVESEESNLQYTLYNINGQMQLDGFLNYDYTISTDNLQNGVYILMLQSNNKRGVQKLIINK